MKTRIFLFIFTCLCSLPNSGFTQNSYSPADPEYYAMERQQMRFDDYQVLLFNYRGFVCPRQYSTTSFTSVQFLPISAPSYTFNLNFLDHNTGKTVRDDVPSIWDKWINEGKGIDPLGANFRPNSPFLMVTQDESWQPNAYFRSGTFHKEIENQWLSFSIRSCTSVSYANDEVFLKIILRNRKDKPLKLTLIPQQIANQMNYDGMKGSDTARQVDAFTMGKRTVAGQGLIRYRNHQ